MDVISGMISALEDVSKAVTKRAAQRGRRTQKTTDWQKQADSFSVEASVADTLTNLVCWGAQVSVDGESRGYPAYAAATLPEGDPRRGMRFAMADMNVSVIRTAKGRTIMLQHDVTSPRPYSRLNLIAGTKGVFRAWPRRDIFLESAPPLKKGGHHAFDDAETERIRHEFMHPLFKAAGEAARKAGGHGGMDYLMDVRWVHCLKKGLPLDADVYDLASWCAVSELSERSARSRSMPQDFPDFTRGEWRRECRARLMDAADV